MARRDEGPERLCQRSAASLSAGMLMRMVIYNSAVQACKCIKCKCAAVFKPQAILPQPSLPLFPMQKFAKWHMRRSIEIDARSSVLIEI